MLSHLLKDATDNLDIITQISREYGLEINSAKGCVMIFNVREQPEHICNIKVVQKMKYLGIEIDNKRNYFKTQRRKIIENARKTFWKGIALPSLLYGTNMINLTDDNIRELQKIESVYRCILGAAHNNLNMSLMRKRVINGRINYVKDIQRNMNY